jgi:hypothetical protein
LHTAGTEKAGDAVSAKGFWMIPAKSRKNRK